MTASEAAAPRISSSVQRTLLALLAAGLGAVPLCELLSDRGWLVDVWLSMLVVVAPALLMRARRPAGALQIWPGIVLLVPWLTARFVPQHAVFGLIPTSGTWHQLGALLDDLHHTTRDGVAPVHSTVAIKLALCAMLGLLAALVDLIAVVGRHGALAGVPLLVVYTVSGAVPRDVVRWQLFAFVAVGFLILLALDARDDLNTWGHRVRRPGQPRGRPAVAMSGQRIAALALVAAVILPMFAPTKATNLIADLVHGSGSKGGGGGFGAGGGSIDPFAALKGQLTQSRTVQLATVTVSPTNAARPFYLRENVLSRFTGKGWTVADHGSTQSVEDTDFPSEPGAQGPATVTRFAADIDVRGLTGNPPVFAVPYQVSGLGSATWTPQDQLLLGTKVHSGEHYQESVEQPAPSVAELQAAPAQVDAETAKWLGLPAIPAQVRTLVARLTAGKAGPYARARAISDYFSPTNGFSYSLQTVTGDSGSDLVDFLTNKSGYCQQYAAAMAVMLRLAQVPSRVVLGYTHAPADANGTFKVTTNDAHAWVEAYFAGIGWIPFDPTPLSGAGGGRASVLPWAPHNGSTGTSTAVPTGKVSPHRASHSPNVGTSSSAAAAPGAAGGGQSVSDWLIPIVVIVLVVLLALAPWFTRGRRRRRRMHAARSGDPDPLWTELTDTAVDLGYVWSPARSPRQVARWLREPVGDARPSLAALAQAVERRRYGAGVMSADDRDLRVDLDAVAARLRDGKDRSTRIRARFWPASLNWSPRWWRQRGVRRR